VTLTDDELARHRAYIAEHFEVLPKITDWRWSSP
jgi:phosphoketolase